MTYSYRFSILFVFLFASVRFFAQTEMQQDDLSLKYFSDKVEIVFPEGHSALEVSAFNAFNHEALMVAKDAANSFTINNIFPSEIIKVDYTADGSQQVHTTYLATPSSSSGTINVYFNHPVDTSFSQGQNAINLGNTLEDKLIAYINACTATLDIAIYNSSSPSATSGIAGAINAARARGVQVRVIYDGSTSSSMIPLLNASIPVLASPTSIDYGIMHNKFVIFDAASADANKPLVWTGSTNWTTSQIDGPDKNSAIIIQDQALAAAYTLEFQEMWGGSGAVPNTANSKFGPYKTNNTPHTFVIGGRQVESYFSPSDGTNAHIIAAINSANTDINIATMVVTRTDITNAIRNKFNAGVTNINLVTDSQNPSGNQFSTIQSNILAGHAVICPLSGIMHHKFMVVDNFNSASDPLVTVGSHNWSSAAENKNDENMLIVHDRFIANQYYQAFVYLYQQSGGVLKADSFTVKNTDIVVYPNPSEGIINLENKSNANLTDVKVNVYDLLGHQVLQKTWSQFNNPQLDLSGVASGMYLVRLQTNETTADFKILKH